MPFWWRRRRKPWYSTGWKRRYRRPFWKRRRTTRRRRRRPAFRRRRRLRRRTRKVRRKFKKIFITQWQPDSIVNCKIKGVGTIVAGANGSQYRCYTDNKEEYTIPKAPGGGLIGYETYSLQYLYEEWKARHNIWTKSNDYKDLCLYQKCKFTFYNHPTTDFLIQYSRQPPFKLEPETYMDLHPQNMLLSKHKRALLSTASNPNGKKKLTLTIRPPKLMQRKWYFQETLAPANLLSISATACNFGYSLYGPNTQSPCITLYCLNTAFYQLHDWSNTKQDKYLPYSTYPTTGYTFKGPKGEVTIANNNSLTYAKSVSLQEGFFQVKVLNATQVLSGTAKIHNNPITICRYNPSADTGTGNAVWLVDTFSSSGWTQPSPSKFQIVGVPLYIAFLGIMDFVLRTTQDKGIFTHSMFVCKSPAIKILTPHEQTVFPFIDYSFMQGKLPYDEFMTLQHQANWYPTAEKQVETLNNFVTCGNLVPKYSNLPSSTWQLNYKYVFYFKWGGPKITDYTVQNPKDQGTYIIPDKLFKTIQVANPLKQAYKAMFREWDIRRGCLTKTAIKRMSENLRSDSSVQSDDSEPETKKKKVTAQVPAYNQEEEDIQSCFQSLFQEEAQPQTEDISQLIQYHQQQQQKLKLNIIQLLTDLKKKQRHLQMQTGLL
nr:MAG: ORF1 [Torque teno midi virus]